MPSSLSFFCLAFLTLLVGKVAALNVTVGTKTLLPAELISFNTPIRQSCNTGPTNCTGVVNQFTACANNNTCLCSDPTVLALVACEQCMFTQLIKRNVKPANDLEGQTTVISGYVGACTKLNFTNPALSPKDTRTKLAVTADWEGPFGQGLNTFTTVITVMVAAVMGVGLISVVNTM